MAIFYCLALWLEMAENWENPEATFVGLILLLVILATKINLWKFCSFIIFTTACFLYFNFPDVANHVNLIIFANLIILITASYYWLRRDRFINPEDLYQTLASPLRVSLVAVYFWAGFHKLNTDFFNPYFSCSNSMFLGIVEMLTSTVLGIPTFLILGLITGIFIKHILPEYAIAIIRNKSKQIISYLIILGILSAVGYGILLYLNLTNKIFPLFVLSTSIFVVLWEVVGGVVMLIPRYQLLMFCLSIFMHLVLAPIGFVDFGSLAFALWLTFIPANYYGCLQQQITLPWLNLKVGVISSYIVINIIGGLVSGFYYLTNFEFNINSIAGIIFIISALIVLAPLVKQLCEKPDDWQGVTVIKTKIPWLTYGAIAILAIFASTSYLGLRTAGNFSMFSNLRTEGETSNHLLLGSNPLKIWNYQEDTVKIIEIDDKKAKVGHKYRPLKDHYLPVVEFKKLIYQWTKAGYTVPLVFEYGDRLYRTNNIVNDPTWQTPNRTWSMKLLDFRIIQPDNGEPNYCRW
ncbi:MAG: hypothetical protein AAGE96_14970 [Cyanobacteria bacterium P01_G01_bin.19]